MVFVWASRDRLAPMRMVWEDRSGPIQMIWYERGQDNYPLYEIKRWEKRRARASTKVHRRVRREPRELKFEMDRYMRRMFAGKLGEWPVYRYGTRKTTKIKNGGRRR